MKLGKPRQNVFWKKAGAQALDYPYHNIWCLRSHEKHALKSSLGRNFFHQTFRHPDGGIKPGTFGSEVHCSTKYSIRHADFKVKKFWYIKIWGLWPFVWCTKFFILKYSWLMELLVEWWTLDPKAPGTTPCQVSWKFGEKMSTVRGF